MQSPTVSDCIRPVVRCLQNVTHLFVFSISFTLFCTAANTKPIFAAALYLTCTIRCTIEASGRFYKRDKRGTASPTPIQKSDRQWHHKRSFLWTFLFCLQLLKSDYWSTLWKYWLDKVTVYVLGPCTFPIWSHAPTLLILEVVKPPMCRLQVCHTCSRWSSLTPSALQRCSPGESLFLFYFVVVVGVVESILCLQQQHHQPQLPSYSLLTYVFYCLQLAMDTYQQLYCLNNTVGKYSNHSWCQWFLNRLTVTRSENHT